METMKEIVDDEAREISNLVQEAYKTDKGIYENDFWIKLAGVGELSKNRSWEELKYFSKLVASGKSEKFERGVLFSGIPSNWSEDVISAHDEYDSKWDPLVISAAVDAMLSLKSWNFADEAFWIRVKDLLDDCTKSTSDIQSLFRVLDSQYFLSQSIPARKVEQLKERYLDADLKIIPEKSQDCADLQDQEQESLLKEESDNRVEEGNRSPPSKKIKIEAANEKKNFADKLKTGDTDAEMVSSLELKVNWKTDEAIETKKTKLAEMHRMIQAQQETAEEIEKEIALLEEKELCKEKNRLLLDDLTRMMPDCAKEEFYRVSRIFFAAMVEKSGTEGFVNFCSEVEQALSNTNSKINKDILEHTSGSKHTIFGINTSLSAASTEKSIAVCMSNLPDRKMIYRIFVLRQVLQKYVDSELSLSDCFKNFMENDFKVIQSKGKEKDNMHELQSWMKDVTKFKKEMGRFLSENQGFRRKETGKDMLTRLFPEIPAAVITDLVEFTGEFMSKRKVDLGDKSRNEGKAKHTNA